MDTKKIVIIGGGFVGIVTALRLAKKKMKGVSITLVSNRPHFEYHGALYRLVTGTSPLEVCIPLNEIFEGTNVTIVQDEIVSLDREHNVAGGSSGSRYHYDYLVLGLGAETNYFNIPGLKEFSFGMKTVNDALRLKRHISEVILTCKTGTKDEQVCATNFVVVGGGATGTELAGDLIVYARKLAGEYGIDPSLITVDIIEGAPRILSALPEKFTKRLEYHLRGLGVNIFTNRTIEREEIERVYLKDMQLKTKTVIWTAGVMAPRLFHDWGFPTDNRGRVEVNEHFQPKDMKNIFVGGDAVIAEYWGMAQTAHRHGEHIADVIAARITGGRPPTFKPKAPIYAIPSGPEWAAVSWNNMTFFGSIGWTLRRAADLLVFSWMLPPRKAWDVFRSGKNICDSCSICSIEIDPKIMERHRHVKQAT